MLTRTQVVLVVLAVVAGVLTAVSYWDARRIGVQNPVRWAAVNGAIAVVAVPTYVVAGTIVGPLFIYLAAAEHHVFMRGDVVDAPEEGGSDASEDDEERSETERPGSRDSQSDDHDDGSGSAEPAEETAGDNPTETGFTLPGEGPAIRDTGDDERPS